MAAVAAASLRDPLMWAYVRSHVRNPDILVPWACVRCAQEWKGEGTWS